MTIPNTNMAATRPQKATPSGVGMVGSAGEGQLGWVSSSFFTSTDDNPRLRLGENKRVTVLPPQAYIPTRGIGSGLRNVSQHAQRAVPGLSHMWSGETEFRTARHVVVPRNNKALVPLTSLPNNHWVAWPTLEAIIEQQKFCLLRLLRLDPESSQIWNQVKLFFEQNPKLSLQPDDLPECRRADGAKLVGNTEQQAHYLSAALHLNPIDAHIWWAAAEQLLGNQKLLLKTGDVPKAHRKNWSGLKGRLDQIAYCLQWTLHLDPKGTKAWDNLAGFCRTYPSVSLAANGFPREHRIAWSGLKSEVEREKYCLLQALHLNPTDNTPWQDIAGFLWRYPTVSLKPSDFPEPHRTTWSRLPSRAAQQKYCLRLGLCHNPEDAELWKILIMFARENTSVAIGADILPGPHRQAWANLSTRKEQEKYCLLQLLELDTGSTWAWRELGALIYRHHMIISPKELPRGLRNKWKKYKNLMHRVRYCLLKALNTKNIDRYTWFQLKRFTEIARFRIGKRQLPKKYGRVWPKSRAAKSSFCDKMIQRLDAKCSEAQRQRFANYCAHYQKTPLVLEARDLNILMELASVAATMKPLKITATENKKRRLQEQGGKSAKRVRR